MNKNKVISTVLTLTFFVCALQAQTYVQFNREVQPEGNSVKFFHNEIYQVLDTLPTDSTNIKQYRITVMDDTIIVGKSVHNYDEKITDYQNKKNNFVKIDTKNNEIFCDVKLLKKDNILDGAYIIDKNNNKIILSANNKIAKSKYGDFFRLVIPNQPTIWYKTSELTEYKTDPFYLTWWFIAVVLFVVLIIGVAIGYLVAKLFCKKEKLPEVEYDGSNITEWAKDRNTSIELLKLYNPEYEDIWNEIHEQGTVWNEIQQKLKGQTLKIKQLINNTDEKTLNKVKYNGGRLTDFAQKYNMTVQELADLNSDIPKDWNNKNDKEKWKIIEKLHGKELFVKNVAQPAIYQGDFLTVADFNKTIRVLNTFIEQTQTNTIIEIKKTLPTSEDKNKITELEKIIGTKEANIKSLSDELVSKEDELKSTIFAKNNLENKIKETEKTILIVDFLKEYAGKVCDYLNFCQGTVYKSAIKLYNDLQQPDKAGILLLNFTTAIKDLQTDKWLQILSEIREHGIIITSNQEIICSFEQPQNNEEKLREFKRFLFNEFIAKYSSSLLILTEAFRNLNRFGVSISDNQQAEFADFVRNIKNKAGSIELKIKYVPLFEKGTKDEHIHFIKPAGNNVSRAYLEVIKGLEKDDIAEIVSYGITTEFDDTEQTQVKLAQ